MALSAYCDEAKESIGMKTFICLIVLLTFPCVCLHAQEYLLDFDRTCTTNGKNLEYECEKSDDPKHYIHKDNGVWKAKTINGIQQTIFKVLSEDENILVLEQRTVYSGNQVLYIMKKNNQFYLIQVAYSNILKDNETTTKLRCVYTN